MKDSAFGLPMDLGGWFRWHTICDVAQEAIPIEMLPQQQRFTLPTVCVLASIGDDLKQRFQFAVLLYKPEHRKQLQPRFERFATVFAMPAMSGHTGKPWMKTPRYAVRLKPEDAKWMSVLSHNTTLVDLGRIFTTGLVPVFFSRTLTMSKCPRPVVFASPNYGLGKADSEHTAVVVMNKSRTCKTSELYQVANTLIVSPKTINPQNFDRAWALRRVPRLMAITGTWCWERAWCTAYDERLVTLPITGYIGAQPAEVH